MTKSKPLLIISPTHPPVWFQTRKINQKNAIADDIQLPGFIRPIFAPLLMLNNKPKYPNSI